MRRELLNILCCPVCKGTLEISVEEQHEEEVVKGSLSCTQCQERYPIEDSMPNLLPPNMRL